jgi:hypothetical protein
MKWMIHLTLLIALVHHQEAYHVVFEQIGELASSVTYIHVKLTIEFDAIELHIKEYVEKLKGFQKQIITSNYGMPDPVQKIITEHSARHLQRQIIDRQVEAAQRVIKNRLVTSTQLLQNVQQLKNSMPAPSEKDKLIIQADQSSVPNSTATPEKKLNINLQFQQNPVIKDIIANRGPRFVNPLGLVLGAFGTFMGLFNKRQIDNLRQEINTKHNLMIEVLQDQKRVIGDMKATLTVLNTFMASSHFYDLSVFISEVMDIENEIRNRIQWAAHAIQAAQNHRLAIDFLTDVQLKALYTKLTRQSLGMGQQLLTENPSDFYQLETSYFFDGNNVHLLLHVPMVSKNSKLRLLKLHPFPLPLNENFTITPAVHDDILAISSGWDRLSVILSATDLLSCHSINKVYLCDRHGVLSKELNNTCLGALYLQDFTIARDLCDFKIHPSQEMIQQLLNNWFLIHSPIVQTGFISCANGTQRETYIKAGINKIHLSPGCQANLAEHRLVADGSIHLPSDITHFEWTWNAATELQLNPTVLNEYINELQTAGINDPSLEDLSHLKIKHNSKFNFLFYFLSFIFSSVAIGLIFFYFSAVITHTIIRNYRKIFSTCLKTPLVEPLQVEPINYPLLQQQQPAQAPLPHMYPMH